MSRLVPPAVLQGRLARIGWWLMRRSDQEYLLAVERAVNNRITQLREESAAMTAWIDGQDPPEGWDPYEAMGRVLLAKATSAPFNEEEALFSTIVISVYALMSRGLDEDTAMAMVESAMDKGDVRITLDATGQLEIEIGEGIVKPSPVYEQLEFDL